MQFQILELWQHCALLFMAYVNAWGKMNAVPWQECCQVACQHLNIMGIELISREFKAGISHSTYGKCPNTQIFLLDWENSQTTHMQPLKWTWKFFWYNLVNIMLEKGQDFVKTIAIPECICLCWQQHEWRGFLKILWIKNVTPPSKLLLDETFGAFILWPLLDTLCGWSWMRKTLQSMVL